MSSAKLVPETRELTGDDALAVLRRVGWLTLLKDAWQRLRVADGFSHARSFAYLTSLVAIEALVGLVGLANVIHTGSLSRVIDAAILKVVPGPAGHTLTTAVSQANHNGAEHHYGAIVLGLVASLVTATTAMGQLERGLNRIYGVEQDRTFREKYLVAVLAALGAGTLTTAAFVCLALGDQLFTSNPSGLLGTLWSDLRWPLGIALIAIAVTVSFRQSPRRRQPRLSWMVVGSTISVSMWALSTAGLGLFYWSSSSFGSTYGPLAGVVALLLWSLLSAISLFYGAAVAAQLEAVRAGVPGPQDQRKVASSDPETGDAASPTIHCS
ncbi:MAG TPA: YhjD/YihY/BrkB family envelope integrity protein [Acidimicrobiales bacterium]